MPLFVELVANDRPAIEQQDLCDGAYAMRQVEAACMVDAVREVTRMVRTTQTEAGILIREP
jgi:hypothetical protein